MPEHSVLFSYCACFAPALENRKAGATEAQIIHAFGESKMLRLAETTHWKSSSIRKRKQHICISSLIIFNQFVNSQSDATCEAQKANGTSLWKTVVVFPTKKLVRSHFRRKNFVAQCRKLSGVTLSQWPNFKNMNDSLPEWSCAAPIKNDQWKVSDDEGNQGVSHVVRVEVLQIYYLLSCAGGWLSQHCCNVATATRYKSQ